MSAKTLRWVAGGLCVFLLFAGCAEKTDLALKFTPNDSTLYKVHIEALKDFTFVQPSLKKSKEEQTGPIIDVEFLQQVQLVDPDGSAIAKITIQAIKYLVKDRSGVKFNFDSKDAGSKKSGLTRLIGKSYTVKISPDSSVKVVDALSIRKLVTRGMDGKVAKDFLNDKSIIKRHEISALPDTNTSSLAVGDTWSRIKVGPGGMLIPKSFEKIYTLKSIETKSGQKIATVEMTAIPTSKTPEGETLPTSSMGPFSGMFEPDEKYIGTMTLNLDTGKVMRYSENLTAKYVAAEQPAGKKDVDPDTLTMGFTNIIIVEVVE